MSVKIMLVDDHKLVRQGLANLIGSHADLEIVAQAGNVAEALDAADRVKPDLAVLDIQLPDGSSFECCRKLIQEYGCKVLLLSAYVDKLMVYNAVEAKASGYLLKYEGAATIVDAIRKIIEGQTVYASEVNVFIADLINKQDNLTPRENEILMLIAQGQTNKEIGGQLYISEKTVRNYVTRILNKLGLNNRTEAAVHWHNECQN